MDIRIYSEYYEGSLCKKGVEVYAKLIDGYSRMVLKTNGVQQCFYDKLGFDGKNKPSDKDVFKPQVFEVNSVAIGLVCCMDINEPIVCQAVLEKLLKSKCSYKILAISAEMTTKSWFNNDTLESYFHGINVVLANGCELGPKSFITDTNGKKLANLECTLGDINIINCGI